MTRLRNAVMLSLLLGVAPALAQTPAPSPGAGASSTPAGPIVGGRRVPPSGQAKPSGTATSLMPQPVNQAEMIKAQKAAEARSKAWDAKTRHTMGSICHGC
jgi:hypothetical protein